MSTASSIRRVKDNWKVKVRDIEEKRTDRALYAITSAIKSASDLKTPIDTSTLINSGYVEVQDSSSGKVGRVGYTASYAAAVHNASGKLDGQPRADFGVTRAGVAFGGGTKVGNYWDPDAEPRFLEKAGEETKPKITGILKKVYSNDAG